jgi:H+-translocating NAD(P) transhydrogenase subunit beta
MIIAGIVVGAAGTLFTQLMAKAMNRSITNVLFKQLGCSGQRRSGRHRQPEVDGASDAAIMMASPIR